MGEEAIQYERGMTFEKVWAAFDRMRADDEFRAREFERKMQESDQAFERSRQEFDRKMQESKEADERRAQEFDRKMQESREAFELSRQKSEREMQELRLSMRETDRQLRLSMRETDRQMKESAKRLDKQLGRLGNRIGELVEELLVPDTLAKFNAMGYTFTKICPNVTIKNKDGKELAEIDFMLENGDYVLVGEVKLQPNAYDVKDHVERMKKIRVHSDERNDKRKLIGAVAGALFPEDVKKYAQAAGFFVITAAGEDVNIEMPPVGWEPRTDWIL
ncbi:hypothetical protein AGMMS50276_13940 [Synergistales bacterium]|nr:hypothetical protein AGMMS50276_13940 [Synergistales bacterium]